MDPPIWMVWDTLAQYVALATTEWRDKLPIFGKPIARSIPDARHDRRTVLDAHAVRDCGRHRR